MASPFFILELVFTRRPEAPATSSSGFGLGGAYLVELDQRARRLCSERLGLAGLGPGGAGSRLFETEVELVRALASRLGEGGCLVTARGRQLDLPILEALALRHDVPLPGHFALGDPYDARRSPYGTAKQLDLSSYLADGDRRLRGLSPEVLLSLLCPGAPPLQRRQLDADETQGDARRRALATYLLFLRVQRLRGLLSEAEIRGRIEELGGAGLEPALAALADRAAFAGPEPAPAATLADGFGDGCLFAFDIETVVDFEALSNALGRPVLGEAELPAALAELGGGPQDFPLAPFHRVVSVAFVIWDPKSGRIELDRLGLGGRSLAGAPLPEERDLLLAFWRAARGKRLASYNGRRFDLPVLFFRSLPHPFDLSWYLAERRPPHEQYRHPQSVRQLDLFDRLGGGLSPGKLGDLLQTIGLPGKIGTDGGDVARLWAEGQGGAIADYCLADAAQTFLLALRFLRVAGELDAEGEARAIAAAKERFSREPALRSILELGTRFFGGRP